jgi:hypothetical protein
MKLQCSVPNLRFHYDEKGDSRRLVVAFDFALSAKIAKAR